MIEERKKFLHPVSTALCKVYNVLYENREVAFPLSDIQIDKIDSTIKTVNADYFGVARFPNAESQASAYFCLIIKDHAFLDANKRLAVLWLEIFCEALNIKLSLPEGITLDILAVSIEREALDDKIFILIQQILFAGKK